MKVIKPHVERMCTDDEAQLALFTALDIIEYVLLPSSLPSHNFSNHTISSDTKLTSKSLVSPIVSSAALLTTTPQGRRALFYLLVPRTRRHFTPAQIATLAETDEVRLRTSKKDTGIREDEIRKAASEGLLEFVKNEGPKVATETGGSLVVGEIMLYAEGGESSWLIFTVYHPLIVIYLIHRQVSRNRGSPAKPLASAYPSEMFEEPHPIDLPHTSRLYKTLLQGGHFSHTTHTVARSPSFSPSIFASSFLKIIGEETTVAMAQGDGAFVVAEFLERIVEEGSDDERDVVRRWFDRRVRSGLYNGEGKGKKVLLEKVAKLG